MGKRENQQLSCLRDFAAQLRSVTILHSQCPLSQADQNSARDCVTLWCSVVLDNLFFLSNSDIEFYRCREVSNRRNVFLHSVIECLERHPIDELIDVLKNIDSDLLSLIENSDRCFDLRFNSVIKTKPRGFNWLCNMLRYCILQSRCDVVETFQRMHQTCSFMGRLTLVVEPQREKALYDWVARQDAIAHRSAVDYTSLAEIVEKWFQHPIEFPSHGKFGNGASYIFDDATTRDIYWKYRASAQTPLMSYVHRRYFDDNLLHGQGIPASEPSSKLSFVPKNYAKLRSIAIEDPGKMWVQQYGLAAIDKWFVSHPVLREKISLHDSSLNTRLACRGSRDGSFATLDLSNASDDVSWELVRAVFRRTPLFPLIVAGRSRSVIDHHGVRHELHSHATMGSALCFPIETMVFAAIVWETIESFGHDPRRQTFAIYGDDIICGAFYAQAVVDRLKHYGFSPNTDKTFMGRGVFRFRESCGGEYLNGADVAPVRISRRFSGLVSNGARPEQYLALIDMANRCFCALPSARRLIISSLLSLPRHLQPLFSEPGGDGLYSFCPTNQHLFRDIARSTDYQRNVYCHGTVTTGRSKSEPHKELIRCYHWFNLFGEDGPSGSLTARVSTVTMPKGLALVSTQVPRYRSRH